MTQDANTQDQSKIEALEDLFDLFAVDKKRATGGAPFKVGGTTFMVARATNPRYVAARQRLLMEVLEKFGDGQGEDEDNPEIAKKAEERENYYQSAHAKLVARHLIVGWDKLKLQGKTYEGYDKSVAEKLTAMEDFMEALTAFAYNRQNYAPTVEAEDVKN